MHAGGVEFDDAFFVRKSAVSHAVVIGIVFLNLTHSDRGIKSVLSVLEHLVTVVDAVPSIRARDKNGRLRGTEAFARSGRRWRLRRCGPRRLLCVEAHRERSESSAGEELPAGDVHSFPPISRFKETRKYNKRRERA